MPGVLSVEVSLRLLSRFGDLAIFPSSGSVTRHPLSLHGVPRGRFPRFTGTFEVLRRPGSLPPRFVSFAWRYREATARFAPAGYGRPLPAGLDLWSPGALTGIGRGDLRVLPGSWADPLCACPGRVPRGTPTPGRFSAEDVAFRSPHDVGSPFQSLEAGYHGLHTRCLRFVAAGYPDTTQDSLPVGGHPLPGRFRTYWVHDEGFRVLSIAFSFLPSQASPGARGVSSEGRPVRFRNRFEDSEPPGIPDFAPKPMRSSGLLNEEEDRTAYPRRDAPGIVVQDRVVVTTWGVSTARLWPCPIPPPPVQAPIFLGAPSAVP